MTGKVLDIETICPKCDYEFTVTYVSHEAEAAESRAAQLEEELELANAHAARLMQERDAAQRAIEAQARRIENLQMTLGQSRLTELVTDKIGYEP